MKPVRYLAMRLADAGFASVAIDYRMIFRGGRIEEALADVDAAARWWIDAQERFALDRSRIAVVGFSAGATLALLHAAQVPDRYFRLVSFFGVYDFAGLHGRLAGTMRRLALRSSEPDVWKAHSPVERCTAPQPLLLVHGAADTLVPVAQAHRMQSRRQALGLPVALREFPDAPHGFLNDATLPATRDAADAVIDFLRT